MSFVSQGLDVDLLLDLNALTTNLNLLLQKSDETEKRNVNAPPRDLHSKLQQVPVLSETKGQRVLKRLSSCNIVILLLIIRFWNFISTNPGER